MEVGILMTATERTGDIAEIARQVEQCGFESLWIPEHPVIPVGFKTPVPIGSGPLPEHYNRWADPFITLTVAATVTKRIKLATGICLLPEREPLMTAKVIASLDRYSGGRVVLGVGAGWLREETEVMGAQFKTRWRRLRETAEAMRACWTQKEPSYQGELIQFPPVRCEPKPIQKSGPPILLGGHTPKALERVAQHYDGWCPLIFDITAFKRDVDTVRKLAREAGRNSDTLIFSPFVDPRDGNVPTDDLKQLRDIGVSRIVIFSQKLASEVADGAAMDWLQRTTPIVEHAQKL
ncbi:MAG: LLM class F420-dependent oxidoreductase [Candidatus Binatia bacterium]